MSDAAKPTKTRYKTRNWAQYNGALKARGSLTVYLDRDMQWLATPSGKRGRQQIFSASSSASASNACSICRCARHWVPRAPTTAEKSFGLTLHEERGDL